MNEKLKELSDEDLMSLYQSGDALAFETLYLRHSGRVLGFLQKRANPQTARDLLQEIFFKLHRARSQYSAQYPFLPWLFAITRNVLIDFLRLKETKISLKSSDETELLPGPVEQKTLCTEDLPEDLIMALGTLPANQRRAIELRYLSDWTFEKIAEDMKTSPMNARQIISRGIKKLKAGFGGSNE